MEERLGPLKTTELKETSGSKPTKSNPIPPNSINGKTSTTCYDKASENHSNDNSLATDDQTDPTDIEARWAAFENDRKQRWNELCKQPHAAAEFLGHQYNSIVPERFQLSVVDICMLQLPLERMKTRDLLKEMHRLWKEDGNPQPRGWRMAPFHVIETLLKKTHVLANDLAASIKTDTPLTEQEIAKRLVDMSRR